MTQIMSHSLGVKFYQHTAFDQQGVCIQMSRWLHPKTSMQTLFKYYQNASSEKSITTIEML